LPAAAPGVTNTPTAARWINIWQDADAAAFVRSVAGGNETVPTVIIDGQAVVNPPPRRVVAAARRGAG